MRYTYQQRQDRRENQGDVSEEGTGETWGGGASDMPSSDMPSYLLWDGSIPTTQPRSHLGPPLPFCYVTPEGASLHIAHWKEWGFDGFFWRM